MFNQRAAEASRVYTRAHYAAKQNERRGARAAKIEQALRLAFSEAPDLFAGLDPAALAGPIVALVADIEAGRM